MSQDKVPLGHTAIIMEYKTSAWIGLTFKGKKRGRRRHAELKIICGIILNWLQ
jgi:hypothetical protein